MYSFFMFFLLDTQSLAATGNRPKGVLTRASPSLCLYKDRILE